MKRFVIQSLLGVNYITDRKNDRVFAFGSGIEYVSEAQDHRRSYSTDDAQAICDWLNTREGL